MNRFDGGQLETLLGVRRNAGRTFAMLQAPQQRQADCAAVGVCEADGRQEIASLLPRLPVLPHAIVVAE